MSSTIQFLIGVALGVGLVELRERLPRGDIAEVLVMASVVALVGGPSDGIPVGWLRIALFIYVVARLLTASAPSTSPGQSDGRQHLVPFLPSLAVGASGVFTVAAWGKLAMGLGLAGAFIVYGGPRVRSAVALLMLVQILDRFV
ncbi:MAG: hypothetical protein IPI67_14225 [Myxococcales bacterium]|nr:hypothetical protein [Myxococcales bacterium]